MYIITLLILDELIAMAFGLTDQKIPSMIYYSCLTQTKMFDAFGGSYNLPLTDWLTERVISLPMHTELMRNS